MAYQYTVNGQVFQVGEFANDGVQATTAQQGTDPNNPNDQVAINQNLVVKIIRPFSTSIVCCGTKSKKPSPPTTGSLFKFRLSKLNTRSKLVSSTSLGSGTELPSA